MKAENLIKILSQLNPNTEVFVEAMSSCEANEVLVETWSSGDTDAYICDSAQAHIDYCDTLNAHGIKSLVIYKANGTKEEIL